MQKWIFSLKRDNCLYLKLLLAVILVSFSALDKLQAQNQGVFFANASSKNIVEGANFTVEFTIKNIEPTNFKPPIFENFDILGGPNQSRSIVHINGKSEKSQVISYVLRPHKIGTFEIGAAYCDYKGQKLATLPLTVNVIKSDKKAIAQEDIPTDKDIFVRLEVSNDTAYLGERIVLDYVLYTTKNVRSYDIKSESEFLGFFVKHVSGRKSEARQEEINGTTYTIQTIESRYLFPQKSGVFDIMPANITLGLPDGRQRSKRFFFSNNLKPYTVVSNASKIHIMDLPENAPSSFSGAIGSYQMQASIDKNKLSTDDALTLSITVAGNGDPKYILPPSQEHLTDFEIYEPNTIEIGERESFGEIQTVKTFQYQAIPLKTGSLTIEAEFSYFDSALRTYKTIKSKPITVNVSQGTNNTNINLADSENSTRILTGIMKSKNLGKRSASLIGGPFHFSLLGLSFLAIGFILFKKRKIDIEAGIDPLVKKRNKARAIAEKRLSKAKILLEEKDHKAFYDEISKSLLGFIADKLNVLPSEISKTNVANKLLANNVQPEIVAQVKTVLTKAEVAIYAGKKEGGMEETYEVTRTLISDLAEVI